MTAGDAVLSHLYGCREDRAGGIAWILCALSEGVGGQCPLVTVLCQCTYVVCIDAVSFCIDGEFT